MHRIAAGALPLPRVSVSPRVGGVSGEHRRVDTVSSTLDSHASIKERRAEVRGWENLTLLEQCIGGVGLLIVFGIGIAVLPGVPPWILGPALVVPYAVLAEIYTRKFPPLYGPSLCRTSRRVPRTYANSIAGRTRAYWRVPGRRGVLVALVGAFLALAGFGNAASDTSLLQDLRAHGVRSSAVVVDVGTSTTRYGKHQLDSASVRFAVSAKHEVVEDLQIIDTVPLDIITSR